MYRIHKNVNDTERVIKLGVEKMTHCIYDISV